MRIGVDARNLVPNLSGIGRYVLEMCRALGAQGHSLVLYLPEAPKTGLPNLPGCEIRIWNFKGPWLRAIWSMTALPKAANKDGLDFFWGPAHRLPRGLSADLPTILTIHDLVWRKAAETMHWQTWIGERAFMRPSLKRADRIVAISHATARDIVAFQPETAGRIEIIHPGLTELPPPGGRPLTPVDSEGNAERYALFVGTLEPRKNLVRLLEAFASLTPSRIANLKLVIAGGQGWQLGNLSTLIAKLDIEKRVILTGYVSDSELSQLYSGAEFLLIPSLYEGFGLPIIEAQSFGVPAITANGSSMPEVAGDAALYVDPDDTAGIAHAILRLASDAELRTELIDRCKCNAKRFSWVSAAHRMTASSQPTITCRPDVD